MEKTSLECNRIKLEDIRYLAFEGGSVKGIAEVGALRKAVENGLNLESLNGIAGTSAGAIVAVFLATGHSIQEMEDIIKEMEFETFMDQDTDAIRNALFDIKDQKTKSATASKAATHSIPLTAASSVMKKSFGLFKGEVFRKWLEQKISEKIFADTGESKKYLTFGQLHQLAQKYPEKYRDLYVVGNCVNTNLAEVFSHKTPEMIISDAVRISMSIPVIFYPHQVYVQDKETGRRKLDPHKKDLLYVDGGATNNLPTFVFDELQFWPEEYREKLPNFSGGQYANPATLSFSLVNKNMRDYLTGKTSELPAKGIKSFLRYLAAVAKSVKSTQRSDRILAHEQWRTIYIDTCGIDTLDFNLSDAQKEQLIASGEKGVEDFLSLPAGNYSPTNSPQKNASSAALIAQFRASLNVPGEQQNTIANVSNTSNNSEPSSVHVANYNK